MVNRIYLNNAVHCETCANCSENKNSGLCSCKVKEKECLKIEQCPLFKFDNSKDWFPVLLAYGDPQHGRVEYIVPFSMIKEHEQQCFNNHGQSAQRLKERGGLAWNEMWAVTHDMKFRDSPLRDNDKAKKPMMDFALEWGAKKKIPENEYLIPVEWSVCGFVKVQANSPEEAIEVLHKNNDDIMVPSDKRMKYIDGSFGVSGYDDKESCVTMVEMYTKDYRDGKKFYTLN